MNKKDNKFKANIIGGFCVAIVGIIGALWLLIDREAISGAEFVALSLGFSVIGLIIAFAAEIQEFSIAGNGVKLKELRSEAEKTIEELEQAKIEIFRFLVQKSTGTDGGYYQKSNSIKRTNYFIQLFENMEKFNCLEKVDSEIKEALNVIMVDEYNQLKLVHNNAINKSYIFSKNDAPQNLYVMTNDQVIKSYGAKNSISEYKEAKKALFNDFERYAELYAIKVKLDNLENKHA
ncbi:hypothetical protein ACFPT0_13300 [Acinetobacter portensis]|uniref:hypothetical protein n=1 Tax=Acinetobacter portensis TaxID=1839785 RepID=UPI00128C1690|nr:hypothetical protein [Acinetobacter portensis]